MSGVVIGIDPGDTTGVAVLNSETGDPVAMHQFTKEKFFGWLDLCIARMRPIVFVVEDFRLQRARAGAQTGSRFIASQVIGVVQREGLKHDIPVVMQEISKCRTGEKYSQVMVPKDHAESHMFEAYNHGYYWLVTHRGIPTSLQRSMALKKHNVQPVNLDKADVLD